jgi:hypothetical protein
VPSPAETLRAAIRQFEREKTKLDRQAVRNTTRRDKAIRKAHASGLTVREIAKLAKLGHARVGQIVKDR